MRDLAIGCGSALLGLIVGVILMIAATQWLSPQDTPSAPAPIPSATRPDVSITASAPFINAQLQQTIQQSGFAKQATVSLVAPNVVQVAAVIEMNVLGQRISLNTTARLRVSVRAGRIVLAVERVDTGNALIPPALIAPTVENLRAQAEDQTNLLAQRALQGASLRVTNVRISSGELTVDLTSQ